MSRLFDTNVLDYVFDRAEPAKQGMGQELVTEHMSARNMVLSTQVLQELYVTLTRKKRLGEADALEVVSTFAQERIVPASADTVLRGVALGRRHQLSAWDALILQAALDAGVRHAVLRRFPGRRALWRSRRSESVRAAGARTEGHLRAEIADCAPLGGHSVHANGLP